MFDKLEDLLHHYEELMNTLSEPDVANDPKRFRKLMKEQSDLQPIVEAYKEYKQCKQNIEDSLAILDEESDEEMRELAKEELSDSKAKLGELEQKLKILLLPRIQTMIRTLLWKSVQVPAARKLLYLRQKFTVCMSIMQSAEDGKWKLLRQMRPVLAV